MCFIAHITVHKFCDSATCRKYIGNMPVQQYRCHVRTTGQAPDYTVLLEGNRCTENIDPVNFGVVHWEREDVVSAEGNCAHVNCLRQRRHAAFWVYRHHMETERNDWTDERIRAEERNLLHRAVAQHVSMAGLEDRARQKYYSGEDPIRRQLAIDLILRELAERTDYLDYRNFPIDLTFERQQCGL